MSTVALILVAAVAFVAYMAFLYSLIMGDGYGHRAASGLPRSHKPDLFDPEKFHPQPLT